MKYYEMFDAIAKALTKSDASNNVGGGQTAVGGVGASEVQKMIEKAISENQVVDKELIESAISEKLATLNAVDFEIIHVSSDLFDLSNGYPYTLQEVPFGKTYSGAPLVVPVQQFFAAATQDYSVQIYSVTNTGFKVRVNSKIMTPTESTDARRVGIYALVIPQSYHVPD